MCLAEMAIAGGVGASVTVPRAGSPATTLFGESAGRVVVAVDPAAASRAAELCERLGVPCVALGESGSARLTIAMTSAEDGADAPTPVLDLDLESLRAAHQRTFAEALG